MIVSRRGTLAMLALSGPALALPPAGVLAPPGGARLEEVVVAGVPMRLWLPDGMGAASRLVAFSHGANANAAKYDALTRAWAGEGHAVAAVLHADSPDHPGGGRIGRPEAWKERLAGMRIAVGELSGRYPGVPVIAAGHSYGALVAQALGGAEVALSGDGGAIPDPRVTRIIAFSPPGPLPGFIDRAGWSKIAVPLFVATGTADVLPIVAPTWDAHKASFEASTVNPRWLWVGEGVDHYFGNRIGRPDHAPSAEQARLFEAALGASVAFIEDAPPPQQPAGALLLAL